MAQQKKDGRSYRTEIIIALIGLIGVLGGALFANWDKVFNRSNNGSGSVSAPPTATDTEPAHGTGNTLSPEFESQHETETPPEFVFEPDTTPSPAHNTQADPETAPASESISNAIDVRGIWLSPGRYTSYNFTQKGHEITWDLRERSDKGTGKVEGRIFAFDVGGKRVEYKVAQKDSKGKPVVMYTTHADFGHIVLFRTCDDFKRFLRDVDQFPEWKNYRGDIVDKFQYQRCPEALE